MDDTKKVYREGEKDMKEAGRDLDGHDLGDDVGNIGDEARARVGNAGDDLRRGAQDLEREAERHEPR
jgi:hypothetical protein